ncbi:MAG: DUF3341 domain-containing protein [Polyangiaceae bacterium]
MKARLWAEFNDPQTLLSAARALRDRGFPDLDAFTPYPLPEFDDIIGAQRPWLIPAAVLAAACLGGGLSFVLIWWTAAVNYPLDVGGRPLNSFVADIPLMFESSVLTAAMTGFALSLGLSKMPRLGHPLERLEGFERCTLDRFWLGVGNVRAAQLTELPEACRELGATQVHLPESSND